MRENFMKGNYGVFILDNAPLGQALDDRIGGGGLPAQLITAERHQIAALDGLMLPQDQTKTVFTFKDFWCSHRHCSFSNLLEYTYSLTH